MTTRIQMANTPYIATRQAGEATVTVISEGGLLWDARFPAPEVEWRRAMPEADAEGRVWLGLNVVIVRLGEALIVVDPGLDDPDSAWQRRRAEVWPRWPVRRTAGLAAALDELRIDPADVTHVVITHPHGDHYAGVVVEREGGFAPRFPNARHVMGRSDWEGNADRAEPGTDLVRLEVIDRLGLLELVDEARQIVPGVTLLPAPGESPGHIVVRVESREDVLYLLGDVVHHACEVEQIAWGPPHADLETLMATRRRLFAEAARRGALVINAHELFPPWGRIVAVDDGYRWVRG
jgi:glyoxylase-like metal-dependent hydrolase (beta-lactamase superfamily II)